MEEEFGNSSNSSALALAAFPIVLSILSIPIAVFNGLIAIVLLSSTSVAVTVRVPLINLLVANLFTAVLLLYGVLISVVLVLSDATEPPPLLCRSALWLYNVTVEAKLLGLVAFSVMVFRTVICGTRKIQRRWLILSLVANWVIATLIHIDILVPPIYGVEYAGNAACFPTDLKGYWNYQEVVRLTWTVIRIVVLLLVCICIPSGALCYIKRYTILEGYGAQYKKALVKFAAFLLGGNVLNVLSLVTPWIVSNALPGNVVGVYLAYTIGVLAAVPTPILIVVFLQPVQKGLRHLFCSKHQDSETIPMQQAEMPLKIEVETCSNCDI